MKKQEKSYKEMMLQQKRANYQKFRKSMAKQPAKPKVVHLTVSSESNQKRNENSVLSDIHQCPSFQNSSLAQNDSKHEIDQYFEIFEKQQQMIDKIKSEQDDIVSRAAKKAKIEPELLKEKVSVEQKDQKEKKGNKEKPVPPFKKFRRDRSQKPPEPENMELSSLYLEPNSDANDQIKQGEVEAQLSVEGGGAPSFGPGVPISSDKDV